MSGTIERTQLSYSSMTLLQSCEQRYWHYKVNKTPVNTEDDRTAFDVGSATHEIVELLDWGLKGDVTVKRVDAAIRNYRDAAPHKGLIHAMALNLIAQQKASGLICVKAEQQIESPEYMGFIDLIAKFPNGDWYIVDLKTSAYKPNEALIARLPMDRQLNLYSYFAKAMAGILGLNADQFKGCIYRVVTKSKANQRATESYDDYVNRLCKSKSVTVYDVVIPAEKMDPPAVYEMFKDAYLKSMALRDGEAPIKNLGACYNYYKLCPYFDKCHGSEADEIVASLSVRTTEDYTELIDTKLTATNPEDIL